MTKAGKVTILGINGHVGHWIAKAFVDAGWQVTGFGRSNKYPIPGVRFAQGDADSVADMAAAVADVEVVVNALNLPYAEWDKGRMEAQTSRVIAAMGKTGKTLLYPGNIYNYAASDRVITPDLQQHPETERGAIRMRSEALLEAAAARGDMRVIILRAGDFFGPETYGDWFDLGILREAGKVAMPGAPDMAHSWAYLPDLAGAFEKLAWHRDSFGPVERFHFAGHYVTNKQMLAAVIAAAPTPLKVVGFPWAMFRVIGLFMPMMRELLKMRYLWQNPMALKDERLDAILGPDFGTPLNEAVAVTTARFFTKDKLAA